MDKVFNPDHRKWISPVTNLGASMARVKEMVRAKKDSLLLIQPYVSSSLGGNDEGCSTSLNVTTSSTADLSMDLDEDCDVKYAEKWSESDAACEAAVAAVGGAEFFNLKPKKKKKKKTAPGRGSRQKSKTGEEEDDENNDEDGEEEEASGKDPGDVSSAKDVNGLPGAQQEETTTLYEKFNYENIKVENEDVEIGGNIDESSVEQIDTWFPETLNSDDDDIGLEEGEFHNRASRRDFYREKFRELHSKELINFDASDDSDASHEETQDQVGLSSEEENDNASSSDEEEPKLTNAFEPPVTVEDEDEEPQPGPSRPAATSIPSKRSTKQKKANNDECDKDPQGTRAAKFPQNSDEQSENIASTHDENSCTESAADFKRFIDWVFCQTKQREKRQKSVIRPGLAASLKLKQEEVAKLQGTTSATLATVAGEVFQDEAVMKSSSMPLLAPPIDPNARTTLQSLAIFITHGEDPSCFPWKSVNVQQQINDDFAYDEFVKRMEQQKRDIENPNMKDYLVDKQEDFLVQIMVYQATDPDDVLPDEVKLRRKRGDEDDALPHHGWATSGRKLHQDLVGSNSSVRHSYIGPNRYIEPKLAYELHLLGSHTVGDLVKAIRCENDYVYLKEVAHPEEFTVEPAEYAKEKFPSCMILIGDTVYSDPLVSKVDYVNVINEWAKRPPQKRVGPFRSGDMNTKLRDLQLRFGFPYVFIHLGGCEHIFVFTKARLLHTEDDHLKKNYPKVVGITRFKNVYCRVDNEYLARWAVLDYKEFPENPMLLCNECVLMYCYDKHKKKRGNFRLYPFTQMANLL